MRVAYNLFMAGLYVHVPFCRKKCHYCDFVIALSPDGSRHEAFLNALKLEAGRYRARFQETEFETVYLGGGTPSLLTENEFDRLFSILKENFRWKAAAEITCEVNPGDISPEKAAHLKRLGINRVSLGAQSFHEDTLSRINRAHDAGAIESSFRLLRDAGFESINLDLILSLPGEDWERALVSLEKAVALNPEHFSIYELTVEENTVFGRMRREGRLNVPGEDEQFLTLSKTRDFLQSKGYRHYELLNYAKPSFESRHNLLYWKNGDYLGLGPGAWSYFDGRRFRFAPSYDGYLSKISKGNWNPDEEDVLDQLQKEVESFQLALRLSDGAELKDFPKATRKLEEEISGLEEKGLLILEKGKARLSKKGQFLAETVFSELSARPS